MKFEFQYSYVVLLQHSHTDPFICPLWLSPCDKCKSWLIVTEAMWSPKPKTLALWPFTKKPWPASVLG